MALRSALVTAVALLTVAGPSPSPTPTPSTPPSTPPGVISFAGLPEAPIGASLADLSADGTVTTSLDACGPTFTRTPAASPVFADDHLVLIWADPPLRTPEGVGVGTAAADVRRAYPDAVELAGRPGTFPGLLVPGEGDKAYLLLTDQGRVQKLIVGYERFARLLHETGFGSC